MKQDIADPAGGLRVYLAAPGTFHGTEHVTDEIARHLSDSSCITQEQVPSGEPCLQIVPRKRSAMKTRQNSTSLVCEPKQL